MPWALLRSGDTLPPVEGLEDDRDRERQLYERARQGDRAALGDLLRRHGPRLYRSVLLPRLGSRAAAEDALSVTYTKVVERLNQFEWRSSGFYPWLRTVALRVAIDHLRTRKRESLFEPGDLERELDHAPPSRQENDIIEEHDLAAARAKVQEALDRMNPRYALAIRRRILEQGSREDLANELEVSVATADVVLHRAMGALRKSLERSGGRA